MALAYIEKPIGFIYFPFVVAVSVASIKHIKKKKKEKIRNPDSGLSTMSLSGYVCVLLHSDNAAGADRSIYIHYLTALH